jgi:predicted O-methyltransferase YrrM
MPRTASTVIAGHLAVRFGLNNLGEFGTQHSKSQESGDIYQWVQKQQTCVITLLGNNLQWIDDLKKFITQGAFDLIVCLDRENTTDCCVSLYHAESLNQYHWNSVPETINMKTFEVSQDQIDGWLKMYSQYRSAVKLAQEIPTNHVSMTYEQYLNKDTVEIQEQKFSARSEDRQQLKINSVSTNFSYHQLCLNYHDVHEQIEQARKEDFRHCNFHFYKTQIFNSMWNNDFGYDLTNTRSLTGLCLLYHVIRYFDCKNILEIGYQHGTSFMTMAEASEPGTTLTGIDIDLDSTRHNRFYKQFIGNRQVNLVKTPSQLFKPQGMYDFVFIDGCHLYPQVFIDLATIKNHIGPNTIMLIDDYKFPGVDQAIDDFLALGTGFVPFLREGRQAIYFHHESHDANDFLDNVLAHKFYDLATLYNEEYKSYNVTTLNFWPSVWNDRDPRVFWLICKRLKI